MDMPLRMNNLQEIDISIFCDFMLTAGNEEETIAPVCDKIHDITLA